MSERFIAWARPFHQDLVRILVDEAVADEFSKKPLYRSAMMSWSDATPFIERAERVVKRLNRSTLAVAAAELKRGGLKRLFNKCWKEDERDYPQ